MHILVSWDIHADGQEWNDLNLAMRQALSQYSWVKPLATVYIIQIDNEEQREAIRSSLVSICKANPKKANFIVSPAMIGGPYNGWLATDLWPKIRQRVEEVDGS